MTSTGPIASESALPATAERALDEPAAPGPILVPEPLASEGRRAGRGFITSYGTGRRCASAGCETLLSRYNAAGSCALHSMKVGSDSITI